MHTLVDTEKEGPILNREFEVCEESEFDVSEVEDAKLMRRCSNGTIIDENEQFQPVTNDELHEAINYKKWSRLSSVSQSTDATLTSASTRSLEMVLEPTQDVQLCLLALDNLSMYAATFSFLELLQVTVLGYYKNMHYKNFKKSALEETAYQPGILATSEK